MNTMLRLGIAGTGAMAATYARTIMAVPDLSLDAVLSNDADRAAQFSAAHGATVGTADLTALLDRVDAVYVATEPHRHADVVTAALMAGRPVLVEKPLSPDAATTHRLLDLSQERGVPLVEAIWTLVLPGFAALRQAVNAGHHGAPLRLAFDFSLPVDPFHASKLFDAATGGGVLLDRAVYGVAAAHDLLGPVADQNVTLRRTAQGIETDAILVLTHENGAQSVISLSFDAVGSNALDLACTRANLRLGPPSLAAEALQVTPYRSAPPPTSAPSLASRLKQRPGLRRIKRTLTQIRGQSYPWGAFPYQPMLAHFADVVRQGAKTSTVITPDLMRAVADIVDQARRG